MILLNTRTRLAAAAISLLALAACGGGPVNDAAPRPNSVPPEVAARYQAMPDGEYTIPAVDTGYLNDATVRKEVAYNGPDSPGTIVVDPYARVLYHVEEGGRATRYGIAVGREGKGFSGAAVINRKAEWPRWTPTANMVRSEPEVYGPVAGGLPGGLENPLGARALYLYRGGRDTYYRIHGTNNASTIGRATSAGCIRLYNQDIVDLFAATELGSPVKVRTPDESMALEGEMVEGPDGLMIPMASLSPEVQNQIRMGQTPWPAFFAGSSISPTNSIGSEAALQAHSINDQAPLTN
ncbi:L,D-transpeptidase [Frigidibacter sp. MR17.14]|uniref:L,D-transpeptidase n=1 Tax=Frigidibacter sp. MR17.14 TaxID=3126509 RepID=UPI003012D253